MKLIDLAHKYVKTEKFEVPDDTSPNVPDKYIEKVVGLGRLFKPCSTRLGNLEFPFVESAINSVDVEATAKSKLGCSSIPDEVIQALSMGIYEKLYSELSEVECSIIKLLSVYIIISI